MPIITISGTDQYAKTGGLGSYSVITTLTFDGGTPDAIGDHDGTGDPATIFTVTGDVIVKVIAICTTTLVFDLNAAIEIGISGDTGAIIPTTDLTVEGLAARETWHDATPDSEIELLSVINGYIITDGNDIILDTTVANVTSGVIEFTCYWTPINSAGNVV